jgi:queuine tRNA-ribosyltransferase
MKSKHPNILELPHGPILLPAFLPDATRGVVRAVDSADLEACGVQALMMNTFHLMQRPGSSTVQYLGGLHTMAGWQRPIVTDSGGFQAYSLIHQNAKYGSLSSKGITFQPDGTSRKLNLSPEKSVQLQLSYDADIVTCLDDCTHVEASREAQRTSVARTIDWAKRGKATFKRIIAQQGREGVQRPLLFAVIQGGGDRELRQACAEALLEIGFDGFGYGGWPLDSKGNLLLDIIAYTRELVPQRYPMHALGLGHPENIVQCFQAGYTLFDSAMPTRDARHGRLYVFDAPPRETGAMGPSFSYVYVQDKKHIKANEPISTLCDCPCCQRYTLGYLHHLFKINDCLYQRLATLHNVRFMMQLMAVLRGV